MNLHNDAWIYYLQKHYTKVIYEKKTDDLMDANQPNEIVSSSVKHHSFGIGSVTHGGKCTQLFMTCIHFAGKSGVLSLENATSNSATRVA